MRTMTKAKRMGLTPQTALGLLKTGNRRFQANLRANRNILAQVNSTADGQFPFAVVLSCIDSRTSAELIFDQGLGDIFSIRVAGNIVNDDILGSMEFSCKLAGSKLIVVLGHSACGAIKGACNGVELEHLTGLLRKIQPSIQSIRESQAVETHDFLDKVSAKNVDLVIDEIREKSYTLNTMIEAGEIGIVGGIYSVKTGAIVFGDLISGKKSKRPHHQMGNSPPVTMASSGAASHTTLPH